MTDPADGTSSAATNTGSAATGTCPDARAALTDRVDAHGDRDRAGQRHEAAQRIDLEIHPGQRKKPAYGDRGSKIPRRPTHTPTAPRQDVRIPATADPKQLGNRVRRGPAEQP